MSGTNYTMNGIIYTATDRAVSAIGTDNNPITKTDVAQTGTTERITLNVNGVVTDQILQDLIIPAIMELTE